MELKTLGDKVSDIFDAIGRIEMKLQDIDDRVNELYSKVNDGQTEIRDEIRDVSVTCDDVVDKVDSMIFKMESVEDVFTREINGIRDSIGDDISSAKSDINSNIDQLKD